MKQQNMPAGVKIHLDSHMHTRAHTDFMFVQHYV